MSTNNYQAKSAGLFELFLMNRAFSILKSPDALYTTIFEILYLRHIRISDVSSLYLIVCGIRGLGGGNTSMWTSCPALYSISHSNLLRRSWFSLNTVLFFLTERAST